MKPTQAEIEAARKELKSRAYMWEIPDDILVAALTAAAEAGEQQPDDTFAHGACVMKERCAQVAQSYGGDGANGHIIAAAIRALKDSK